MNDFDNKQICSYKDIDMFGFTCDVCGRKVNGCHCINGMKFCAKCYQETFGNNNQQNEIQKLKQQLEEKDKLLKCYQEEEKLIADILGDKDLTIIGSRVHLKNLIVELKNKIKDRDIVIEEKDKEIKSLIVDYEKRISQEQELMSNMEHRLTEKQNTIDEINKEFVQAVHDWKTLCAEKDKEIEKLKQQYTILENENGKLAKELIVKNYKKAQKEVSFGIQLAIQELEKVKDTLKHFCNIHNDEYYGVKSQVKGIEQDVCDQINQQIKELKGE